MKRILLLVLMVVAVALLTGCGKKTASLQPGVKVDMAVLTLDGNLPDQTVDQKRELDIVIRWMDNDIIKILNQAGFNAALIKDRAEYRTNMGKLLIVDVKAFHAGNRAMRAFVGYGAGAASLDLTYQLLDEKGGVMTEWVDGVGSSYGGTYCAQTLNRRAVAKLVDIFNK